jgi:hypothetical protein
MNAELYFIGAGITQMILVATGVGVVSTNKNMDIEERSLVIILICLASLLAAAVWPVTFFAGLGILGGLWVGKKIS